MLCFYVSGNERVKNRNANVSGGEAWRCSFTYTYYKFNIWWDWIEKIWMWFTQFEVFNAWQSTHTLVSDLLRWEVCHFINPWPWGVLFSRRYPEKLLSVSLDQLPLTWLLQCCHTFKLELSYWLLKIIVFSVELSYRLLKFIVFSSYIIIKCISNLLLIKCIYWKFPAICLSIFICRVGIRAYNKEVSS